MLYIVATPIGNLGDISPRALEVLRSVQLIACEDTRHTHKLLSRYEISARCVRCDARSEERVFMSVMLPLFKKGESAAFVSDAGTPGVSDPGALVAELAWRHEVPVCPVPGASSATAVVSAAGLHGKGFHFEGFLQRKAGARRSRLTELMERNEAFVLYESPHRIAVLLQEIADIDSMREVLLARELTKKFEQLMRGTAEALRAQWGTVSAAKGECTVLVYPSKKA